MADTYSTRVFLPSPVCVLPYFAPACSTSQTTFCQKEGAKVMLQKPGPAISTFTISSQEDRTKSASSAATSLGGMPRGFARSMATLVARSPCFGSLAGSMTAFSGQARPFLSRNSPTREWTVLYACIACLSCDDRYFLWIEVFLEKPF